MARTPAWGWRGRDGVGGHHAAGWRSRTAGSRAVPSRLCEVPGSVRSLDGPCRCRCTGSRGMRRPPAEGGHPQCASYAIRLDPERKRGRGAGRGPVERRSATGRRAARPGSRTAIGHPTAFPVERLEGFHSRSIQHPRMPSRRLCRITPLVNNRTKNSICNNILTLSKYSLACEINFKLP